MIFVDTDVGIAAPVKENKTGVPLTSQLQLRSDIHCHYEVEIMQTFNERPDNNNLPVPYNIAFDALDCNGHI